MTHTTALPRRIPACTLVVLLCTAVPALFVTSLVRAQPMADPAQGKVVCMVVDADGQPVADADVTVEFFDRLTVADTRTTTTDANGMVTIENVPLGPTRSLRFSASRNGQSYRHGPVFTPVGTELQRVRFELSDQAAGGSAPPHGMPTRQGMHAMPPADNSNNIPSDEAPAATQPAPTDAPHDHTHTAMPADMGMANMPGMMQTTVLQEFVQLFLDDNRVFWSARQNLFIPASRQAADSGDENSTPAPASDTYIINLPDGAKHAAVTNQPYDQKAAVDVEAATITITDLQPGRHVIAYRCQLPYDKPHQIWTVQTSAPTGVWAVRVVDDRFTLTSEQLQPIESEQQGKLQAAGNLQAGAVVHLQADNLPVWRWQWTAPTAVIVAVILAVTLAVLGARRGTPAKPVHTI